MSPNLPKTVDLVNQSQYKPADAVFDAVHNVMHLYRSMQLRGLRDSTRDPAHELTHMEYKVLGFFARHPGASQSELVAHSGRDKAQVARLIKGLRDQQLLDAQVDETDRRSTRLRLSPLGRNVIDSLEGMGAHVSNLAVQGMSAEECTQLLSLLMRIKGNLEAEAGAAPAADKD
ncbi:MarR family winged helix-turn-helix transcriptional regulator [Duganella sp. FT27W]|uniref:MarR family winged helix-turn-helix transcriptional regulator n=1 Tax=Duganella sp. FT27W TaxID=2654636 RepID=UPI00128DD03C|nr:MarR family transcriptional regulator [Duganella sp. FT27W]MPQ57851.1 MarR family transcriptional regulator [Duganella sp. FT27W]